MKKLSYLFVSLFIIAALASCTKDDSAPVELKCNTVKVESGPVAYVTPYIIPGQNNGGNRTCADVEEAFGLSVGYFRCGEKIDYNNGDFAGSFPDGLIVSVDDGTYVSFEVKDCIELDGKLYRVGAVIVKGGNAANVYYYNEGSYGDVGLASPANKNGKPAGLSNLSFCFVECGHNYPELVIALKTYIAESVPGEIPVYNRIGWTVSGGLGVSKGRGLHMGYNLYNYNGDNEFVLNRATLDAIVGQIGTIKARDYWEGPVHYLEVKIDSDDPAIFFDETYLYVGSLAGYTGRYFTSFPFYQNEFSGERIFKINFEDITL